MPGLRMSKTCAIALSRPGTGIQPPPYKACAEPAAVWWQREETVSVFPPTDHRFEHERERDQVSITGRGAQADPRSEFAHISWHDLFESLNEAKADLARFAFANELLAHDNKVLRIASENCSLAYTEKVHETNDLRAKLDARNGQIASLQRELAGVHAALAGSLAQIGRDTAYVRDVLEAMEAMETPLPATTKK